MSKFQTMSKQQIEILEEDIRRNIDLFEKVQEAFSKGKPSKGKPKPVKSLNHVLVPT